jgi:hypothetical protein
LLHAAVLGGGRFGLGRLQCVGRLFGALLGKRQKAPVPLGLGPLAERERGEAFVEHAPGLTIQVLRR